jgi:transposase InsO family protein
VSSGTCASKPPNSSHPERLCRILTVSRSGFYRWLAGADARAGRARADAELAERITDIHTESDGTYGAPRVTAELRDEGERVNHTRVARVMRKFNIVGLHSGDLAVRELVLLPKLAGAGAAGLLHLFRSQVLLVGLPSVRRGAVRVLAQLRLDAAAAAEFRHGHPAAGSPAQELASPARHQRGHRTQPKGLLCRRRQLPCVPHQFTHAGINDSEHLPFRINTSGGAPC